MSLDSARHVRDLTDPKTIRALAHPTRLRLLELLAVEGPLTATRAGEHLGESPASCSFHLRSLKKYGFVTEAEGSRGRERPWRIANIGNRWTDAADSPAELTFAGRQLSRVVSDYDLGRFRDWQATQDAYPVKWRAVAGGNNALIFVTAEELQQIVERLIAVIEPYMNRIENKESRPTDALPVMALLYAFPTAPPTDGGDRDDA